MLIAYIILALAAIAVFFYIGLNLSANLPLDSMQYYLFWAAYTIFGLSLANVLFLGKVWQIIQNKRGPVGPRGYRGDTGDMGQYGECFMEQFIIAIKRATLLKIADTLLSAKIITKHSQVYDESRLRLINRYLDMRFQRQIDSPQMYALMDSGIKTTHEIAEYISGLWAKWTMGIIDAVDKDDKTAIIALYTQPTTTPNPAIDKYIMDEIARSDVWNWGHNIVINPPVITVKPFKSWQAQVELGGRHPGAPLKFHMVSYSDIDIKALQSDPLWTSRGYPDAQLLTKINSKIKQGISGSVRRPAIYIPKTWRDPDTNEKYYPLSCVMVETNPDMKSAIVKYILLVSGDIIIPDVVSGPTWQDTTRSTNGGIFYRLDTSNTGYAMLSNAWFASNNTNMAVIKQRLGLHTTTNVPINKDRWEGPVAVPSAFIHKITNVANISAIWNYMPPPISKKGKARTEYLIKYGAPSRYHVNLLTLLPLAKSNEMANDSVLAGMMTVARFKPNQTIQVVDGYAFNNWVLEMGLPRSQLEMLSLTPTAITEPPKPLRPKPDTNNLGLAWYGEPHRDSKYSVFAFLGIVPEGQLLHKASGRTMRFEHYGGPEPELYNLIVIYPTMRHVKRQDNTEYLIGVDKTGNKIRFITRDAAATDPKTTQWTIRSIDTMTKRIRPLDISQTAHNQDSDTNVSNGVVYVALESVDRPSHMLAMTGKMPLGKNRWLAANGMGGNNMRSNRPIFGDVRPGGIKLDGIYLEWSLVANARQAGPMSTFQLQPAG